MHVRAKSCQVAFRNTSVKATVYPSRTLTLTSTSHEVNRRERNFYSSGHWDIFDQGRDSSRLKDPRCLALLKCPSDGADIETARLCLGQVPSRRKLDRSIFPTGFRIALLHNPTYSCVSTNAWHPCPVGTTLNPCHWILKVQALFFRYHTPSNIV